MVPVLVRLGPLTLYSFGAMMALAFLAGGQVVGNGLAARGLDRRHVSSIVWWAAIGGLLGSRLLSIVDEWDRFLVAPLSFIVTGAGFVWYGGLAGGFIAVSIYILVKRLPWLAVTDAIAPGLALGQAIGRVGCQLAGDGDWGTPSTLPWAMAYPRAIFGWDQALDVRVHPAPVYESLAYVVVFAVLMRMGRRPGTYPDGFLICTYLILAAVARFLVEFVRINPKLAFDLSEAQWLSIAIVAVAGGAMLWLAQRSNVLVAFLLLWLLATSSACSAGAKLAPDFVASDLNGQAVRLSAQRGKVVFLNLWTTWCPPCRMEMPSMEALSKKLASQDFLMLAVSEDDGGAAVVRKFVEQMGLSFPVLVDPEGEVGRRFGVYGYPETFIIDRDGRQVARFIGPRDWRDPKLEEALRKLIAAGQWERTPDGG
jgi:phosphatidylglycerol:prolipoprotein diacylglycerol transferase